MKSVLVIDYLSEHSKKRYSSKKTDIQREGFKKALNLFLKASKRIPAYKDFLKRNKINPSKIKTVLDFEKVPYTTKENYIFKYPLKARCWNGVVNNIHTIAASSGSTGEPVFWPREIEQEIEGAEIHELLFKNIFEVKNKNTLFINAFGLGNWIAGMYTEFCVYLMRLKGIPFTLASPGYNQEEIFKLVKNFSKHFEQTIIACHPPIIKMLIENGIEEGIRWTDLNMKFLGAGEGFSENWRDYLLSMVGQKDFLKTFINIYGSADAGLMGFETPLSILVHRNSSFDPILNELLFKNKRNPFLYQFDPRFKYLEAVDGEITISCNASSPLIKYNIHDQGGVLEFQKFKELKSEKFVTHKAWNLPFVYIFGRDKFMTSLYGVNIYPENIKSVVEHAILQKYLTGRFITDKKMDKKQNQYLELRVELKPGVKPNRVIENNLKQKFVETLKKLNSEYNQVEEKYKVKMHPHVILSLFQDPYYFGEGKIKKMS